MKKKTGIAAYRKRQGSVLGFLLPHFLTVSLFTGLMGCESLERKFVRRPKHPKPPPSPVINFEDDSQAMTPLDRYRKHALMFDYWNHDLMEALETSSPNPKRYHHASTEAIGELEAMRRLVTEEIAERFTPLIDERLRLDRQLQRSTLSQAEAALISQALDRQSREIHRTLLWRDVQEHLITVDG